MLRTAGLLALHVEGFVSGLRRRGSPRPAMELRISSPLNYPAAGTLPRPDFHRQAHHSLFWTHSFPNASVGNPGSHMVVDSRQRHSEMTAYVSAQLLIDWIAYC